MSSRNRSAEAAKKLRDTSLNTFIGRAVLNTVSIVEIINGSFERSDLVLDTQGHFYLPLMPMKTFRNLPEVKTVSKKLLSSFSTSEPISSGFSGARVGARYEGSDKPYSVIIPLSDQAIEIIRIDKEVIKETADQLSMHPIAGGSYPCNLPIFRSSSYAEAMSVADTVNDVRLDEIYFSEPKLIQALTVK